MTFFVCNILKISRFFFHISSNKNIKLFFCTKCDKTMEYHWFKRKCVQVQNMIMIEKCFRFSHFSSISTAQFIYEMFARNSKQNTYLAFDMCHREPLVRFQMHSVRFEKLSEMSFSIDAHVPHLVQFFRNVCIKTEPFPWREYTLSANNAFYKLEKHNKNHKP